MISSFTPLALTRITKAKLACDDSGGYLNSVTKSEFPLQVSALHACKLGTKVSISDKGSNPYTFKATSKFTPDKGAAGSLSIIHTATIRRGNFTAYMEHISTEMLDFTVPNVGKPTTAVQVHVTRQFKSDPAELVQYYELSYLNVLDPLENLVQDLSALYAEPTLLPSYAVDIPVSLSPGPYSLAIYEKSSYLGTGPQDSKGVQPKFKKAVKVTVSVLPPS